MTTSPNSCCEKCAQEKDIDYWPDADMPILDCKNPACSCHMHKCKNGTIGCTAGLIEHTCHSQQKHCPNCVFPHNWNCNCSCHTKSDWAEVEAEFEKLCDESYGYIHQTANGRLLNFLRTHLEAAREESYIEGQKHAFGVDRKAVFEEGRKAALKEALELVPEESIVRLFDFPLDKFTETHAESDGWNACRTAIINALKERMK